IKGIEIPVSIKYNFSLYKKDLFVSAGFTSTSYIKENIESSYVVNDRIEASSQDSFGNNIVEFKLVQTTNKEVSPNGSSNFNFANILNFSFGIELPINSKRQSVIFEPYFKYSITPVTQEKIDFSSVGVHLRYNFSIHKK
ncbi:MAG: hypothetical protein WC389_06735, partial [Lutibacter sp.]